MIENAKKAGLTLSESRTVANVTLDIIQNSKKITVTFIADIIEFEKEK